MGSSQSRAESSVDRIKRAETQNGKSQEAQLPSQPPPPPPDPAPTAAPHCLPTSLDASFVPPDAVLRSAGDSPLKLFHTASSARRRPPGSQSPAPSIHAANGAYYDALQHRLQPAFALTAATSHGAFCPCVRPLPCTATAPTRPQGIQRVRTPPPLPHPAYTRPRRRRGLHSPLDARHAHRTAARGVLDTAGPAAPCRCPTKSYDTEKMGVDARQAHGTAARAVLDASAAAVAFIRAGVRVRRRGWLKSYVPPPRGSTSTRSLGLFDAIAPTTAYGFSRLGVYMCVPVCLR
ncbi:hypothetical protein HYPSUDRAFT_199895 [Hypholoma sublateritium FD-334 SS-4]|uniref:Uncharacterized protein n=1 Tax=Hypholoma sublateritium (strain FD-334 SS-4) TaxID=945553 RepID=A0A0D2MN51_HYPSF|nr:hypothetical protein HYPSUDRAFT_199895 [Hypholoma sublateritium FD-334 SS-4]